MAGSEKKDNSLQAQAPLRRVLFYTENLKKQQNIKQICRNLGLWPQMLKNSDAALRVGRLAGLSGAGNPGAGLKKSSSKEQKTKKTIALPEIIIFSGLDEKTLDRFLGCCRDFGFPPIALKAVVTPVNAAWTLEQLIQELTKEHTAILLGGQERTEDREIKTRKKDQ